MCLLIMIVVLLWICMYYLKKKLEVLNGWMLFFLGYGWKKKVWNKRLVGKKLEKSIFKGVIEMMYRD